MGIEKQKGIVAILDALGASYYSDAEVEKFLSSRRNVAQKLDEYLDEKSPIDPGQIQTYQFNDTIVIALLCDNSSATLGQVTAFSAVIRKYLVESMNSGLLFRGAAAIGEFRADEDTNTIMGDAITDAAQWYEVTDWVGVHYTPRSFLHIEKLLEGSADKDNSTFIRYEVPLKGGSTLSTYAINWPRIIKAPAGVSASRRERLLTLLSRHKIPKGTEAKYFNTLKFFDHVVNEPKAKPSPNK